MPSITGKLAIAILLSTTAQCFAADGGRVLNVNSSMELGSEGAPVPGWRLKVFKMDRELVAKNPSAKVSNAAVKREDGGLCMEIPVVKGLAAYQLSTSDMFIDKDGEVEISFDCRLGESEDGAKPNIKCAVDFRAFGDEAPGVMPKNPDHPRYPVLKSFAFKPGSEWSHVSKTFKVIKWHNAYTLWINVSSDDGATIDVPLRLDNFKVELRGGKPCGEAAAVPDKSGGSYFAGEKIKLAVKALLDSKAPSEDVKLDIVADYDSRAWRSFDLKLKRLSDDKSSKGGVYEGSLELPADKFGSYRCEFSKDGSKLSGVGDLSIIHRPVEHKRFSPGWTIGFNNAGVVAPHTRNDEHFKYVQFSLGDSFERNFEIPHLSGMRNVRHWGNWLDIEPKEGEFRSDLTGMSLDGYKKYGMETIFCLVGDLLHCQDSGPMSHFPLFLFKYREERYESKINVMGKDKSYVLLPPAKVYGAYLDYCLKTWGERVHIWELFNEPGLGPFPAKNYIDYLKQSYKTIKERAKGDILLGNGVTGDFGMNVVGWCEQLNAADANYPEYLDGVAFHPYNCATDYQRGVYGLYAKCVKDIASTLKIKKPLWNTECFYIVNARNPQTQFYLNQAVCGANDVQRHYLDGLLLGVKCSSSLEANSLVKRAAPANGQTPLSEMAVATNALSYMLKDMEKLNGLELNKFMRGGIFTDAFGDKATGFVYDLRPAGSVMTPGSANGVKLMDLFGNELPKSAKYAISYEPVFLSGKASDVRSFFAKAKFVPNESCRVIARRFRDEIHLDGINSAGAPGVAEIEFEAASGLPKTQFAFVGESDDCAVKLGSFKGAKTEGVKFKVLLDGEANGEGASSRVEDSPCFDVAKAEKDAKELTLDMGSKAKIWSEGGFLRVKASVKDDDVIAPSRSSAPWEGDALEVFVDPKPFNKLDRDIISGSIPLPCFQFAFGAEAAPDGPGVIGVSRADKAFKTSAACQRTKLQGGYVIDAKIPWAELLRHVQGDIVGLELEIDHKDAKNFAKESLSGKRKGQSYNARLHYPLFKIDETTLKELKGNAFIRNASLQSGVCADPDAWTLNGQTSKAVAKLLDGVGPFGERAVYFEMRDCADAAEGSLLLRQNLSKPDWAKSAKIGAMIKMEGVKALGANDSYWPHGFALTFGQADLSRQLRKQLEGEMPWTSVRYVAALPPGAKTLTLSTGLRHATGKLWISNINVEFMQ